MIFREEKETDELKVSVWTPSLRRVSYATSDTQTLRYTEAVVIRQLDSRLCAKERVPRTGWTVVTSRILSD